MTSHCSGVDYLYFLTPEFSWLAVILFYIYISFIIIAGYSGLYLRAFKHSVSANVHSGGLGFACRGIFLKFGCYYFHSFGFSLLFIPRLLFLCVPLSCFLSD